MPPKSQLLGDAGLLVDPRLDLLRAVKLLLFRECKHQDFAVVRRVAARRHPGNHVVLALGRERDHEDEFLALTHFAEFHNSVVRDHGRGAAACVGIRQAPYVLFVVEHARVLHVENGVKTRLDGKEILRITNVRAQVFGHFVERMEDIRKDLGIGLDDRIGGVADIEAHFARIGVDGRLDRTRHRVEDTQRVAGVGVHAAGIDGGCPGGLLGCGPGVQLASL